jgi:acetyl esterase
VTAGFDPLRDEGRAYAARMKAAGVPVTEIFTEGSLHGFLHTAGAIDESARVFGALADAMARRLFARSLSARAVAPRA